jgi:hypothetical protein
MAHSSAPRVRVLKRHNADAAWDDGWLRPALSWLKSVYARFAPSWSAMIRRWGGVAGMVGGLLWAALSFVFFLQTNEIYFLLDLHASLNPLFYFVRAEYLVVPLAFFLVALLGLYQDEHVRGLRLGRLGFVLSFLGVGLMILLPPLAEWLDYAWLNRPIANSFHGGWIDTPLSEWYSKVVLGWTLLKVGLILVGISSLRARALPIVAMLGLTISSIALLLTTIVGFALSIGVATDLLSYEITYEFNTALYYYGLAPLIAYLFGISWVGVGYALHSKTRHQQSGTPE